MSDDQAALRALARQIRSGKSPVSQQQTMAHLSTPLPAPPSPVHQETDFRPSAMPPMPSLMHSASADSGPAWRGSQEQLDEARALSNSFNGSSTREPFSTSNRQSRSLPLTNMTDSPRGNMAQSYGLEAITKTLSEDAVARNSMPPHKRAVTKASQSLGNEIETQQQKTAQNPPFPEVKQSPQTSFIQACPDHHNGLSATKPKDEVLNITRTFSPDSKSSTPSGDRTSTWEVGPKVGSTSRQASVAVADQVSKSHDDPAELEISQPSLPTHYASSESSEKFVTVNAHNENKVTGPIVTKCPTSSAAEPIALEAIVHRAIASVNDLQRRVDKLEEERERRCFLGSKTRMEPFTVNIQCQNGFSGKVQTHSQMSGADLIRRIRCKAGFDHFETENIVVRLGNQSLAHIAMIGEQGITADAKLTIAW